MRWPQTALTLATIGHLTLGASAARAENYESLGGAHWEAPQPSSHAFETKRTILVVDRTGDARAHAALEAFKAHWNAMRGESFATTTLPLVEIAIGRVEDACTVPARGSLAGEPGDVIVCRDDTLASAGVGGPFRVDAQKHTELGLIKLKSATLRWSTCSLRTAVAHEMGHVMGLAHNDKGLAGDPSIMMSGAGPYKYACSVWFNPYDRHVLGLLYGAPTTATADTASDGSRVAAH